MLDPWFNQAYPLKAIKKKLYWKLFEHNVLESAYRVVFTCEEERRLARGVFSPYNIKEQVIGYGIADPQIDANQCREQFYAKYPDLKSKKIILFVGRIDTKKGCDLLLLGFKRLLDSLNGKSSEYHLVFAGPPEEKYFQELKALEKSCALEKHVTWTGMLLGDIKWGAYLAADVFCLPSHQENFGIVVAEALSVRCPVLISNKVNIHHEISESNGGFVDGDSIDGAFRMLEKWHQLPAGGKDLMRASARECFQRNFLVSESAKKLREIIANASSI
jgi:glycosyltransferase involved in cell wall biosynthesis